MSPVDRRLRLLEGIDVASSSGVEIGPLNRPVVRKSDGPVFYVDYADSAFLRERYRNDPNVDIAAIVDVDGIWGKSTMLECLGKVAPVDYIVASHVIEHVPDLITWLKELRSTLKPAGRVCLAIPDRRFSFDFHRKETGVAEIVSAFYFKERVPSVRQVMDHFFNLVPVDTAQLWRCAVPPLPSNDESQLLGMLNLADDITRNQAYHDVHCWVFTPRSLSRLFIGLAEVGLCDFECETFHDTERDELEFFVTLKASDDKSRMLESWRKVYRTSIDTF